MAVFEHRSLDGTVRRDLTMLSVKLETLADAVVMLTWSDWNTEPRSNRYHFAVRFAEQLPVYFVQPDRTEEGWEFEETETPGVQILHIPEAHLNFVQDLGLALAERGVRQPVYWVYNVHFCDFLRTANSAWTVYHATEDYFSDDFFLTDDDGGIRDKLRRLLKCVDLVVCVSEGVRENLRSKGEYRDEVILLENGCDYAFWSALPAKRQEVERPVAIFQGGLNFRVDYELLEELCRLLPDWDFWFCGRETPSVGWASLRERPNAVYFGNLAPEELRELVCSADVGLVPFRKMELIKRSFPLKSFEYAAAGLPVVSVPIDSLQRFEGVFWFAESAAEFARMLPSAHEAKNDPASLAVRKEASRQQDYDVRFACLTERLVMKPARCSPGLQGNLLVLYDVNSIHVGTLLEHLNSFGQFSRHRISYANCTGVSEPAVDLTVFDGIIIHYSVRVNLTDHLSIAWKKALQAFRGVKGLFIQDEYDTTETARKFIEETGVNLVFTCVPDDERAKVYPQVRFPHVQFVHTLTGYVPADLGRLPPSLPLSARQQVFAYRGRALPFWYGDLGREKQDIGVRMREICEKRELPCDIEWEDSKRIYGRAWFEFLGSARATLGTESGSNIFDDHGELRRSIEEEIGSGRLLNYEDLHQKYLAEYEGKVSMNQISPKIFEAIAMRTALVLFEGDYSGVIQPGEHYISLKKDFSNIEDVLERVMDDNYIEQITQAAFEDVIVSGKYDYPSFVASVDDCFDKFIRGRSGYRPLSVFAGVLDELDENAVESDNLPENLYQFPLSLPDRRQASRNDASETPSIDNVLARVASSRPERPLNVDETLTKDLVKIVAARLVLRVYRLVPVAVRNSLSPMLRRLTGA